MERNIQHVSPQVIASYDVSRRIVYIIFSVGKCNEDGIPVISGFSEKSGPIFYYQPSSNVSFGAGPPNVRQVLYVFIQIIILHKSSNLSKGLINS